MPLQGKIYEEGIFVNPNAMDTRQKKSFAKLLESVLKVASDKIVVQDLFVMNNLTKEQGTEGKFYNWGQLTAMLKPDAVPTELQKVEAGIEEYSLLEYEVKVGITDRSKINAQMDAQSILTAGQAGQAFARSMNAIAFTETYASNVATAAAAAWSPGTATDIQILNDILTAQGRLRAAGFNASVALLTFAQKSRLAQIGWNIGAGMTFKTFMTDQLEIPNWIVVDQINEVFPDGTANIMFNPAGSFILMDKSAYGVFSQRSTTLEFVRDAFAGIDFGIMRKYYAAKGVQTTACQEITGCVI